MTQSRVQLGLFPRANFSRPQGLERSDEAPPTPAMLLPAATRLAARLSDVLGVTVRLAVTNNCTSMVSYTRLTSGVRLRVHHMFLDAPPEVIAALAAYVGKGDRAAGRRLDAFIEQSKHRLRPDWSRARPLVTQGEARDLLEVFRRVNAKYFRDAIQAEIGWARRTRKPRSRSIRLGVYQHLTRRIHINPVLDSEYVPEFFLEFIVFHEMLHQVFAMDERQGARRTLHSAAFRRREREFERYAEAQAWEKENVMRLMRAHGPSTRRR